LKIKLEIEEIYKSGVSNLFDRRAKCTNFKLLGGQTTEGRRDRDAEGVEGGREWRGGVPLSSRLGGLGKRRKFPQRGPAENEFLRILELEKHT